MEPRNLEEPDQPRHDPQWDDFPHISDSLIAALENRMGADRWPNTEMPDREIWFTAGKLSVIDYLKFVQERQFANQAATTSTTDKG